MLHTSCIILIKEVGGSFKVGGSIFGGSLDELD
jgi:hypothetical protein